MPLDLPPDSPSTQKRKRGGTSQLRVVMDTNALYVTPTNIGSASDLVRQEIASVISDAKYPDLDILWYLPEIVRHERQYQMQVEALKLRSAINKIERLLDHNLALSDRVLLDHVESKINEKEKQLGLHEIKLDHGSVDWPKLIHAAAYRNPPFEVGDKEKGFRDALVAESFLQLLAASPKTPRLCRVVLVTSDEMLSKAVKDRIKDVPNASVLANIEELKGLINTIVSNVDENFIALIKPKASKLFFVSSDEKDAIFYREKIQERITEKFKSSLETIPQGATFRQNGRWLIEGPNFSRKEGRRVFWTSRIKIELEAGNIVTENEPKREVYVSNLPPLYDVQTVVPRQPKLSWDAMTNLLTNPINIPHGIYDYSPQISQKRLVSQTGSDTYEVRWSTEISISKDLKKPTIDDIVHIELSCQPIS
jgi:hypothetical protein